MYYKVLRGKPKYMGFNGSMQQGAVGDIIRIDRREDSKKLLKAKLIELIDENLVDYDSDGLLREVQPEEISPDDPKAHIKSDGKVSQPVTDDGEAPRPKMGDLVQVTIEDEESGTKEDKVGEVVRVMKSTARIKFDDGTKESRFSFSEMEIIG